MERKLTMKFTSNNLSKWELEHGGVSILNKAIPIDIFKVIGKIYNKNNDIEYIIDEIYNTINKVITVSSLIDLIQVGNLNTLDRDAAGDKLDNYLEKYNDGIVGAYLQIIKELDADQGYLNKMGTNFEELIDLVTDQISSLKEQLRPKTNTDDTEVKST